jgi:hypothetical protein
MDQHQPEGLSAEELAAEDGVALPDKEVVSILDLNADLDLAIDAAAPIDLGVAANANVAAPIDASASANLLSEGSTSQALGDQGVMINQGISADAIANSTQDSTIDQGAAPAADVPVADTTAADGGLTDPSGTVDQPIEGTDGVVDGAGGAVDGTVGGVVDGAGGAVGGVGDTVDGATGDVGSTVGDLSDGNLLNVNVNLDADANVAAPIDGAVAANANVAAPIDAAVSANIGSVDSDSIAVAQQDAIINQNIDGSAQATTDQTSDIQQP